MKKSKISSAAALWEGSGAAARTQKRLGQQATGGIQAEQEIAAEESELIPWQDWEIPLGEIQDMSKTFVLANCFDQARADEQFPDISGSPSPDVGLLEEVQRLNATDSHDTS